MVLTISRCKDNKNVARKQHFLKKMQSRNNIFIPNSGVSCNRGTVEYRKGDQLERERLRVGELAREWATLHDGSASSPRGDTLGSG